MKKDTFADWLCSRVWILAFLLGLFVNTTVSAYSVLEVLLWALVFFGLRSLFLWAQKRWLGANESGTSKTEKILKGLLACGAVLCSLVVQLMYLKLAAGEPADPEKVMTAGRLVQLAAGPGCITLSICLVTAAFWYMGARAGEMLTAYMILFFTLILSPWGLEPSPVLFLMPLMTAGLLGTEVFLWKQEKNGSEAKASGKVCLAAVLAAGLTLGILLAGGISERFSGAGVLEWPWIWFNGVKDALTDGGFGWAYSVKLQPFNMSGLALIIQNTIYPSADRFGLFQGMVEGAWILLLYLMAKIPAEKQGWTGRIAVLFLLLAPFAETSAAAGPAMVLVPWMVWKTVMSNHFDKEFL